MANFDTQSGGIKMPIVKIRTNRQVTIPKVIFEALGLQEGDFVEVTRNKDTVIIKPKKLVDPDDILTPEDEASIRRGEAQLRRGQGIPWDEVKKQLKSPDFHALSSRAYCGNLNYASAN